jgi:hypothetical protein
MSYEAWLRSLGLRRGTVRQYISHARAWCKVEDWEKFDQEAIESHLDDFSIGSCSARQSAIKKLSSYVEEHGTEDIFAPSPRSRRVTRTKSAFELWLIEVAELSPSTAANYVRALKRNDNSTLCNVASNRYREFKEGAVLPKDVSLAIGSILRSGGMLAAKLCKTRWWDIQFDFEAGWVIQRWPGEEKIYRRHVDPGTVNAFRVLRRWSMPQTDSDPLIPKRPQSNDCMDPRVLNKALTHAYHRGHGMTGLPLVK